MGLVRNFKSGTSIDLGMSHLRNDKKKIPPQGGMVEVQGPNLKKFWTPFVI